MHSPAPPTRAARPLAILLLGSLSLLSCTTPPDFSFQHYYLDPYKPFFSKAEEQSGRVTYNTREPMGRPTQSFQIPKSSSTLRVFILGGSVAQLYDLSDEIHPSLKEALESLLPGKTVEILNCGLSGYDSARAAVIFKEIITYNPDLIIVMSVVNERTHFLPSERLARACGYPGVRALCASAFKIRFIMASPTPEGLKKKLAGNLRIMLQRSRKMGVPVLLSTLPSNLRDMPPHGDLPVDDEDFLEPWIHYEKGEWAEAAAGFRKILRPGTRAWFGLGWDRQASFVNFYLGKCLDKMGDPAGAAQYYMAAQDLDRPTRQLNESVRMVAGEERTLLADIEKAFTAMSPDGLPGRDFFEDDVHWDMRLSPLATVTIAEELLRGARDPAAPVLAPPAEWNPGWLKKSGPAIKAAARGIKPADRKILEVFRYRMWESLEDKGPRISERILSLLETISRSDPHVLEDEGRLAEWIGARHEGNIWKEPSINEAAGWPTILAHTGEFWRRRGRHDLARTFFDAALRRNRKLNRIHLLKALSFLATDERTNAEAEMKLIPDLGRSPEARRRLKAYAAPNLTGPS